MELADGVYSLSVETDIDDREMTLTPAAVETPRGLLVLDVGLPGGADDLAAALEVEGLDLDETWAVVITHQDADHAGCLAEVVERTGGVVFANENDAPSIEGASELVKSTEERAAGYPPATVDCRLVGGETMPTEAGPMEAVFTPGHTPGHTSYYFPEAKLLLGADALNVEDRLVGPRKDVTPDMETAWESVGKLAEYDIEHTLCYHGGYTEEGTERIETLLAER